MPALPVPLLGIVAVTSACEAGAQACLKLARRRRAYMAPGILLYVAVALLLHAAYAYRGVGLVNALWSGTSVALMVAIGYVAFGERLGAAEYAGIALILAGVIAIHAAPSRR